jgi:NitT/TauT family transport system permease protein
MKGKKSLKSINRFIYQDPRQVGLNAVFGNREFGWKFEIIGLLAFIGLWITAAGFIFSRPEFVQFKGFYPAPPSRHYWPPEGKAGSGFPYLSV